MRKLIIPLAIVAALVVGASALTGAWVATRLQSSSAASVVPQVIQYQGVLANSDGKPLEDGVHGVSFRLYSAEQGGRPLWQEGHRINTKNGGFTVILGIQQPFTRSAGPNRPVASVFNTTPLYMGMEVVGQQGEIQPRQMLAAVPFALYAANADTLNGLDSSAFARADAGVTCEFEIRVRTGSSSFDVSDDCLSISEIASAVSGASHVSHALAADGQPIISYKQGGNLKVARCTNISCSATQINTVDSSTNVGNSSSIVIGTDGLPIISYIDDANKDLKVAHCSNPACSSATITVIDTDEIPSSTFATTTAITLGSDGMPVIAYIDTTPTANGLLKVARCTNVACTSFTTNHVLASPVGTASGFEIFTGNKAFATRALSIAIAQDGMPMISYRYAFQMRAMMAHCNDPACNSATISLLANSYPTGDTSIAQGANGLPVVTYFNGGGISLVNCNDADCATFSTKSVVSGLGGTGESHQLVVKADGQIVISYSETPISGPGVNALNFNPGLGLLKCTDSGCTNTKLVSDGTPGLMNSVSIAPDGRITVVYTEGNQGYLLKLAVCHGC